MSIRHVVDDVQTADRRTAGSRGCRLTLRMRGGRTTSGTRGGRPGPGPVPPVRGAASGDPRPAAWWRDRRLTVERSERYHCDGVAVVDRAGRAL